MALHPQAAAVVAQLPPDWRDLHTINSMTAARARALAEAGVAEVSMPAGVAVEEIHVPGAEGSLRARVYRPSTGVPVGTVLWIRGGGFVIGSLEMDVVSAPLARPPAVLWYRSSTGWRQSIHSRQGSKTVTPHCAGRRSTHRNWVATRDRSRSEARAPAAIWQLPSPSWRAIRAARSLRYRCCCIR